MHDDVPAALPLFAFVIALAARPYLVNPVAAIGACVAIAVLPLLVGAACGRPRAAAGRPYICVLFVALGLIIAGRTRPAPKISPERFVTVEAPIGTDWTPRGHVYALRTTRFRVGADEYDAPLTLYARFIPKQIDMEELVRAEGFLRLDDRGRYVVSVKSRRLLTYTGRLRSLDPASWNRTIANRLRRHALAHPDEIAMIEALVLGRGERLSEETRDGFKRGGTYHLLVFSGMQIALAAALIAMLLRWSGATRASDWSLLAFAVIAPLFIGPTASVTRASIGVALYALSRILERPTSIENLWCVAALLRLMIDPRDLADPAFQLTYAGAGALLFIGKPLARSRLRWIPYAAGAELAIAPITLFHFHQYALGGSILTIVMTPIIFVMLLIGVLFCATEWPLLLRAIALLDRLCDSLNALGAHVSGFFAAPALPVMVIAFMVSLAAIACLRDRWRVLLIIAALVTAPASAVMRHLRAARVAHPQVTFLDVGQGDAILLRSGTHAALIDAGGRFDDARFGESVLLPLLVERGVRKLDFVMLTHAHPDHCGGMPAVLRYLEVGSLLISPHRFRGECAQRILAANHGEIRLIRYPARLAVGEFDLFLRPSARAYKRAPENNGSIVTTVGIGGRRILLTGDIEREAESELGQHLTHSDVLKVAHHGSRSSTTREFLDAVSPRLAIISCGRNNLFGHPHTIVLESLGARRIRTLRTDRNGSIEIAVAGGHLLVTPEIDTTR